MKDEKIKAFVTFWPCGVCICGFDLDQGAQDVGPWLADALRDGRRVGYVEADSVVVSSCRCKPVAVTEPTAEEERDAFVKLYEWAKASRAAYKKLYMDEICMSEQLRTELASQKAKFVEHLEAWRANNATFSARCELAMKALRGNRCWLGSTVIEGGGFIGCYRPGPYRSPKTVGAVDPDPWIALESALAALDSMAITSAAVEVPKGDEE